MLPEVSRMSSTAGPADVVPVDGAPADSVPDWPPPTTAMAPLPFGTLPLSEPPPLSLPEPLPLAGTPPVLAPPLVVIPM